MASKLLKFPLNTQTRCFSSAQLRLHRNVYFIPSINGSRIGKIEFKLYDEIVPKTSQNFRALCTGERGFGYTGVPFHRIIPRFMIQGGDTDFAGGFGGRSIYGPKFADENFLKRHDKPGLLSMANSGRNTNGSQFFITTAECPWLDGKHVVFGEVISGMDVVKQIESYGTKSGRPTARIIVEEAGQL